jgi:hypothetical protein
VGLDERRDEVLSLDRAVNDSCGVNRPGRELVPSLSTSVRLATISQGSSPRRNLANSARIQSGKDPYKITVRL